MTADVASARRVLDPDPWTQGEESARRGHLLVELASNAIKDAFDISHDPDPDAPWMSERLATFVTLRREDGDLHGCIGSIEPTKSLRDGVREHALLAAFRDPRSRGLRRDEIDSTSVEVTLLSPLEPLAFTSEADLLRKLRPGQDGLVIEAGMRRAVFLPQVWESLPEPESFLGHLKQKAGLPYDFWSDDLRAWTFQALHWSDSRS